MNFDFSKYGKKSMIYASSSDGELFDDIGKWRDNDLRLPKRIVVRSGVIIDNVTFEYEKMSLSHGGNGGTKRVFELKEGEYIVGVSGDFKSFSNSFMLNSLVFTTNHNNRYECSGGYGATNAFTFSADEGNAICCLHGRAANYMLGVGFYAVKVDQLNIDQSSFNPLNDITKIFSI